MRAAGTAPWPWSSGDDVLDLVRTGDGAVELLRNLDTGRSIDEVRSRLVTANAYLGAQSIAAALARGADLVITGRVADPSLTVAACADWFGWSWDDWERLAGATVAGHLIECGVQVTGGLATDWLELPDLEHLGFPIAEVAADGSCVITKPRGTGGRVCEQTVKEQLVYEIADPNVYLSPDVTVSFLALRVEDLGENRVRVSDARGRPAPAAYKVSATYQDGFHAQGQLAVFGTDAVRKARRAAGMVFERLRGRGVSLRETVVECLGAGACYPRGSGPFPTQDIQETVLHIAVADDSQAAVEGFTLELMPLITAGPPGTTGYGEGRPRVHPLFRSGPVSSHETWCGRGSTCSRSGAARHRLPPPGPRESRLRLGRKQNTLTWLFARPRAESCPTMANVRRRPRAMLFPRGRRSDYETWRTPAAEIRESTPTSE